MDPPGSATFLPRLLTSARRIKLGWEGLEVELLNALLRGEVELESTGRAARAELCDPSVWPRNPIPGTEAAQQELCPVKAAFLLNEVPKPPLCPKQMRLCSHSSTGARPGPQLTASLG